MEVMSEPGFATFSTWVLDVKVTPTGVTGSNLRNLIPTSSYNPAWSPRGDLIAFETAAGISVVPPTGGIPTLVVPGYTPYGAVGDPTWSPDGTSIAYKWQNNSLVMKQVVDATTGTIINGPETTVIPGGIFNGVSGSIGIEDPDWSRLGDRIAFRGGGTTQPDSIYIVNATANGSFKAVPSTAGDRSPTWSPDDPTTMATDETDKFLVYAERTGSGGSGGSSIVRQELATGTETVEFTRSRTTA